MHRIPNRFVRAIISSRVIAASPDFQSAIRNPQSAIAK
jgi:hypothetical protein